MATKLHHSNRPVFKLEHTKSAGANHKKGKKTKKWDAMHHSSSVVQYEHVAVQNHKHNQLPITAEQLMVLQEEHTLDWIKRYTTHEVQQGAIHTKTVILHIVDRGDQARNPNSVFSILKKAE